MAITVPAKRKRISRTSHAQTADTPSLAHSAATVRLLQRLSRTSLLALAERWREEKGGDRVGDQGVTLGPGGSQASVVEDDRALAELSRPLLVDHLVALHPAGFLPSHLAQVDVAYYVERPSVPKPWTAHEMVYLTQQPALTHLKDMDGLALQTRLQQAVDRLCTGYHVWVAQPDHAEDDNPPWHIRLQPPVPPSVAAPSQVLPPAIHILHFPATPFLLFPSSLPTSATLTIKSALATAFSRPPGRVAVGATSQGVVDDVCERNLKGKDWRALRERLLESRTSGARWKKLRTLASSSNDAGEDGPALAPPARRAQVSDDQGKPYVSSLHATKIVQVDGGAKKRQRDEAVGRCFGWEPAPGGELAEWKIPITSLVAPLAAEDEEDPDEPTFTLRLTGTSVLAGIRALVEHGHLATDEHGRDRELPEWMIDAYVGDEDTVELVQTRETGVDGSVD